MSPNQINFAKDARGFRKLREMKKLFLNSDLFGQYASQSLTFGALPSTRHVLCNTLLAFDGADH